MIFEPIVLPAIIVELEVKLAVGTGRGGERLTVYARHGEQRRRAGSNRRHRNNVVIAGKTIGSKIKIKRLTQRMNNTP